MKYATVLRNIIMQLKKTKYLQQAKKTTFSKSSRLNCQKKYLHAGAPPDVFWQPCGIIYLS